MFKGETCPNCHGDNSVLITTSPLDGNGNLLKKKNRWQCRNCRRYFLVNK